MKVVNFINLHNIKVQGNVVFHSISNSTISVEQNEQCPGSCIDITTPEGQVLIISRTELLRALQNIENTVK